MKQLGWGRIPVPVDLTEVHNALADARWNKKAYEWLKEKQLEVLSGSGLQ
jgi:hypothetical protein